MPSWLRIVVVLFAAVAMLDDLRTVPWSAVAPTIAVLSGAFLVLSYGSVALLAWCPLASAVTMTFSYVLATVSHSYAPALLCGCIVLVAVLTGLSRRVALTHLAVTATWVIISAGFLRNSDFVWTAGIPLGASALIGAALRFFLTQYRLNTRRLAVMEVTHQRLREQERLDLARDLHDVVAHELTLVTMQAAGSHRQQDPGELHHTIDTMDSAARSGLHELRTLLHILRDSPGAADERDSSSGLTTGSLYSVARTLMASLERAALRPELDLGGGLDEIPTSIRGTAARVLQEASTNMIKYAPTGSRCVLRVRVQDAAVHVHTENQIRRGAIADSGRKELASGFGLRGIRERVALLDGRVEYGPRNAVWHLDVRIPVA